MKITVLGSGDAFGTGGRFNTCLLVEAGDAWMMLDCGGSSPVALNRAGIVRNGLSTHTGDIPEERAQDGMVIAL